MNKLQIFKNAEFGEVRTVVINNNPYFVGKDICECFGDTNYRRTLARVDEEDKGVSQIDTLGGMQNMTVINESGLYSVLFYMQPQKAKGVSQNEDVINERIAKLKKFKHWVTSEVLPSIRKNGAYINNQENMTAEQIMAEGLLAAQRIIESKDKLIQQMRPKEIFADAVSASNTSILVGDLAKLIAQNGVQIGQKRLFEELRKKGYLIKQKGASWNMPTQRSMEQGLFEIKETSVTHSDGHISVNKTVKVTGKGQVYFINKFIS